MKLFITRIVLALRHFQQWLVAQVMFGFLNFLKLLPADGAMRFADWLTRQIERLTPEERARLAAAADILRRLSES